MTLAGGRADVVPPEVGPAPVEVPVEVPPEAPVEVPFEGAVDVPPEDPAEVAGPADVGLRGDTAVVVGAELARTDAVAPLSRLDPVRSMTSQTVLEATATTAIHARTQTIGRPGLVMTGPFVAGVASVLAQCGEGVAWFG